VLDGTATVGTTTADSTGAWGLDATLADGTHSLTATTTDLAGNVSVASVAITVTVNTAPSGPRVLFADGFESGNFSAWTSATTASGGTAAVQQSIVRTGLWAARLSADGTSTALAWIRKSLGGSFSDITVSFNVRVEGEAAGTDVVALLRVLNSAGTRVVSLFRRNGGVVGVSHLGNTGGVNFNSSLPLSTWAHFDVRLVAAGANASTIIVSRDGTQIYSTATADLGTTGSATVQFGNENAGKKFIIQVDDVTVTSPS
jgi:hypothetical protein